MNVTGRGVMQKAEPEQSDEVEIIGSAKSRLQQAFYSGFHDPSLTVECGSGEARSLGGNNHVHQCKTGPGEEAKI